MSQQLELLSHLEEDVNAWRLNLYVTAATVALVLYEYALTLPAEINRVWRRRKTMSTVLFVAVRYTALFEQLVFLIQFYDFSRSPQTGKFACNFMWQSSVVLQTTFLFSVGALGSLRIYAISTGNKLLKASTVITLGIASAVFNAYSSSIGTMEPLAAPFSGCFYQPHLENTAASSNDSSLPNIVPTDISAGCALLAELLVQIYTWQRTYKIWRQMHTDHTYRPLLTLMLRDGTILYLTSALSTILACTLTSKTLYLIPIASMMSSVLICRSMLQFRRIWYPFSLKYQETSARAITTLSQKLDTVVIIVDLTDSDEHHDSDPEDDLDNSVPDINVPLAAQC